LNYKDNLTWHGNCIKKETPEKRGKKMKELIKKLDKIFVAAAFAEAGEYDTARDILRGDKRPQKVDRKTPTSRARKELRAPGIKR
jgi:hypothetical protein